jgi:hyperosmotically inducible protein
MVNFAGMFRFLFRFVFRAFSLVLLAGIAFAVYHLYASGQLPYLQQAVEDTAVTGSVKAAFAVHRVFGNRPIEIATDGGVVTLSGDVASTKERDGAQELASSVEGVIGVNNRLRVDAALPDDATDTTTKSLGQRLDDAALLTKIRTALHLDREVRKINVDIQVSEGRVMLRGEVPTEAIAEQIRTRVASVGGVESLDDELQLETQP